MISNQVNVLSNLTPETVLQLERVSFNSRATAMPGAIEADDSFGEATTLAGEEININEVIRLSVDTAERMVITTKHLVVGGLCYDQDAESPLENCDAEGKIFHRGSRASGDEEIRFNETLGLDSYGDKDLSAEAVSHQLASHVIVAIRKDRSLMTTLSNLLRSQTGGAKSGWDAVCQEVTEAILQEGWELAPDCIAEAFLGVRWWLDLTDEWRDKLDPLRCLVDQSEAESAWGRAIEAGTIGNPLAQMIDIYEHSGVSYSLSGEGYNCRWDTSSGGAVWVPDAAAEENIRYNVLSKLGVGQVKYFGSVGSQENPCHASYSLDDGKTWVGDDQSWSWSKAMAAMLEASSSKPEATVVSRLMAQEARNYARGVIQSYSEWRNGEVYGVVVYVIDRETGLRIEVHNHEVWGHIGNTYAEQTLESEILNTVLHLQRTLN